MFLILAIVAVIAYIAAFWIALAYYVVRDARRRSLSGAFVFLAGLLGFVPPFLGPLVYLVIRPPHTLEEERSMALEEQALLEPMTVTVESRPCPNCGRDVEEDFIICPYCRTQFARRCGQCDRPLRLGWGVCPYCSTEVGITAVPRPTRTAS